MSDLTPESLLEALFGVYGRAYAVTGAASGLGEAIAAVLASNGANVLMLDSNRQALMDAAKKIEARGGNVTTVAINVADEIGVKESIVQFARACGKLDGLFANAGVSGGPGYGTQAGASEGQLQNQSPDRWRQLFDVNLLGTLNCMQAVVPIMKQQGRGSIVVTTSIAALHAEPFVSYSYAAAKAAANQLVQQAALELAPYGIRVNALAPGFIRTAIAGGKLHDTTTAAPLLHRIPMRRLGDPSEIQGIALLLASDASAYITGCTVPVDGGLLLGNVPCTMTLGE